MDSKTDENRAGLVFVDLLKTNRFHLKFSKFCFFEKIIKKTRLHFKNCGQNRIQKFIVLRPGKIEEGATCVKIEKNNLTSSF
jgi:hypothetical protein